MALSTRASAQSLAILVGSITGAFLAYITQSVLPLTSYLFPSVVGFGLSGLSQNTSNLLIGNPESGLIIYLAIPIITGSLTGLVEKENPWIIGMTSGLVAGIVNLGISLFDLAQLRDFLSTVASTSVVSQLQAQFLLFAVILTLLWGLGAAFSAKATAWAFEKRTG